MLHGHCRAPQVEWLRERVDNLSRELVLARKDSGRLAKQLKVRGRSLYGTVWSIGVSVPSLHVLVDCLSGARMWRQMFFSSDPETSSAFNVACCTS